MNTDKNLEKARDLSLKLLAVLKSENADDAVNDMALTRLLAAIYSLMPPDVSDRLIKLHCDNLCYSVREIRENRIGKIYEN